MAPASRSCWCVPVIGTLQLRHVVAGVVGEAGEVVARQGKGLLEHLVEDPM